MQSTVCVAGDETWWKVWYYDAVFRDQPSPKFIPKKLQDKRCVVLQYYSLEYQSVDPTTQEGLKNALFLTLHGRWQVFCQAI